MAEQTASSEACETGSFVDVTLMFTAVFRCKLCEFVTVHGVDMSDHLRGVHGGSPKTGLGDIQNQSKACTIMGQDPASVVTGLNNSVQNIFSQIQHLESIKFLPGPESEEQIKVKFIPDTACDIHSKIGSVHKKKEDKKYKSLLADSFHKILQLITTCRIESCQADSVTLGKAIKSEAKETPLQKGGLPSDPKGAKMGLEKDYTTAEVPDRCKNRVSAVAPLLSLENTNGTRNEDREKEEDQQRGSRKRQEKRDKMTQEEVVPVSLTTAVALHEDTPSIALAQRQDATTTAVALHEDTPSIALAQRQDASESAARPQAGMEKYLDHDENDVTTGKDMIPDTRKVAQTKDSEKSNADLEQNLSEMERAEDGESFNSRRKSDEEDSVNGQTADASLQVSKLYGNVDFQDIVQRASRSNPDATTITVVQHTGGTRPPTTIHFKKSHKSSAIIPTGESLGITSPFLSKGYAGSKIFACKECHSRYKTQNELERHSNKKHKKKKSYLCEICGDSLATTSGMKTHILRKHGSSSLLTCDVCGYVTRSPARFTIHCKKHNKDASGFYCKPCKKSFVTESKLHQHCNSPMHKNAVDPIICEHCGYVTKKRDNFLVHLRKHTGEKPHKCRHCEYAASDGSTLKRHVMARHSSIRPFHCSQCQFSCVDKKGLTIHMRKHTGERPFSCDQCPYSAKRIGALTVHRRTHLRSKSPPTASEDPAKQASTEVASYVDISDIPFTKVEPEGSYMGQTMSQDSAGSMVTTATNQSTSVPIQIPPDDIVSQYTTNSVRALWQSMS